MLLKPYSHICKMLPAISAPIRDVFHIFWYEVAGMLRLAVPEDAACIRFRGCLSS